MMKNGLIPLGSQMDFNDLNVMEIDVQINTINKF